MDNGAEEDRCKQCTRPMLREKSVNWCEQGKIALQSRRFHPVQRLGRDDRADVECEAVMNG